MTRFSTFAGEQTLSQRNHAAWLAAIARPDVVARGNLAMTRFDEAAQLRRIETPTLVIAAQHDRMTLPRASQHMDDLIPVAGLALSPLPAIWGTGKA